jgi:hypothetical protein
MKMSIALEWDEQVGLSLSKMYPLREGLESYFLTKEYGSSVSDISVIMTCKEKTYDPEAKYRKPKSKFYYNIIFDFFLIRDTMAIGQKKEIIKNQITQISTEVFGTQKFADFDKSAFLQDLSDAVNSIEW